jgi:serine/threonine protein kinase/tetratricopeptide (TPR) repeat protein
MPLAPHSRLGPYEILSPLGEGGMGEVYRAKDPRLGREVAIKVLPERFAGDEDLGRRFQKEARAVAALSHPNVVAIYDVGQEAGTPYAVMELLEGVTLRVRMAHSALAWPKAVEIAAEIAGGLAAAHARGIIHRDLKPENVFLTTDGRVKVLDFGLARWRPELDAEKSGLSTAHTDPGTILGTTGYMSPEQVRGQTAEASSDLFALGCILYEMVSGRRAFAAPTPAETMAAILKEEPPRLEDDIPDLPWDVARAVTHCLQKDVSDRFQSARDLMFDLRASLTGAVSSRSSSSARQRRPIDSLVVLPFANAGGDPDVEFWSDGITETITNALTRAPGLRVIARSTAFRYKGKEIDPLVAGQELKVRAIVTGRVVLRAETLVIQAELLDVSDGSQLWGERFSRPVAEVLAVESEIARQISENLRLHLKGSGVEAVGKRPTENPEAYRAYLKGRFFWNKRTPDGLRKGLEFFQAAIEADPTYALAYAGLADCYDVLGFYNWVAPLEAFPRAKAAARRALEIDSTLTEPRTSLAYAKHYFDWDFAGAERDYREAIARNPGYSTTHGFFANLLTTRGRFEEAMEEVRRAQEIEPLSLIIANSTGFIHLYARRYDEAVAAFRKVADLDRRFIPRHLFLGCAFEGLKRFEDAAREFEEAIRLSEGGTLFRASLARAHAGAGRTEEAAKELRELRSLPPETYVPAFGLATVEAALGNLDSAFRDLERAREERSPWLTFLRVDPAVDPLRRDSRFEALVGQVESGS